MKHSLHPCGVRLETGAEREARGQAGITQCSQHHQQGHRMGKGMPGVFSVPPGPGLGHQLLPALLHHLHPVLRRPGLPVSPHVCQVGDQEHPCCSPIPPELFEPVLSSAVSHCFTSLSASPSSSCPGTLLHLPLPHDGPGFSPFLIPCISPLFPKFLMKLKVQGKKAKLQNWIICSCRKQAWNKDDSRQFLVNIHPSLCCSLQTPL